MPSINDELIEKYFKGLCTGEEALAVQQFLKEHPEHPFLIKEWEQADGQSALPGNYTQQMFDEVDAVIRTSKKTFFAWKYAVAAACMTGIIISVLVINKKQTAPPVLANVKEQAEAIWSVQRNYGKKDTALVLADGSILTLSPNASVRYRADFNKYNKREIFMSGRVFFEVAKNKQKPFTVYSRNLGTTALGTAFYVDAPENAGKLSVELFEGKVVVALTGNPGPAGGEYYLVPGQELVFNTVTGKAHISSFLAKTNRHSIVKEKEQPSQTPGADVSYMFNNQTLADVLDQLSLMYGVDIQYSKATIGNIYFIGKIDRDDSLDKIIHDIAVLNKLSVKKQNGAYILRKKQ
jgi:transmembrane sensor